MTMVQGQLIAAPQDVVELDMKAWNIIWQRGAGEAGTPWRSVEGDTEWEQIPAPTAKELRAAARTFRPSTGMGIDGVVPKAYAWLSDCLLERIGEFMAAIERGGQWPEQVDEARIHLIPKATSGRRPIGLLAALPRLWDRVRAWRVRKWRNENTKKYNWMVEGRGAKRAVWAQSVLQEAARQRGLSSACVLVDLVKAYEQIRLSTVWDEGVRSGYPMSMLRLSLEACTFERRLVYKGVVSEKTAATCTAILAGLGAATDLMALALMGPLDKLCEWHPRMELFVIADDVNIGIEGKDEEEVARLTEDAVKDCIRLLEVEQGMEVSRDTKQSKGKTVGLASTSELCKKVSAKIKKFGIQVRRSARNLGVEFRLGGGRRAKGIKESKWDEVRRRKARAGRMGRRACASVATAGLSPSIGYSVTVTGITDGLLAGWRSLVASSYGHMGGKSVTARLTMEGTDPASIAVVGAVMDWVNAWWDELIDNQAMYDAWRHGAKTVMMASRPNAAVQGGAGAFFAGLRRLGWSSPSPHSVVTRDGTILFFGGGPAPEGTTGADPKTVMKWANDDLQTATALQSQVAKDMNEIGGATGYGREDKRAGNEEGQTSRMFGSAVHEQQAANLWRRGRFEVVKEQIVPWFAPMASVMRAARRRGQRAAAGALRSCVEGGWWTQSRRYSVGAATHDRCACGEAAGTLWHKLGECEKGEEWRAANCGPEVLKQGKAALWDPLYSRGVPARPKPPRSARSWSRWTAMQKGAPAMATGNIYTDGSAVGGWWRATRAAWAVVVKDEEGNTVGVLQGGAGRHRRPYTERSLQQYWRP